MSIGTPGNGTSVVSVLRRIARGALWVLVVLTSGAILLVGGLWFSVFGPGLSPNARAEILIHDLKFGRRAVDAAVRDGEAILEPLRRVSDRYRALHARNAEWIAEVLGRIDSASAREELRGLLARTNASERLARLVGIAGLARQRALPEPILNDPLIRAALAETASSAEARLAILALVHAGEAEASGLLRPLLSRSRDYWVHAATCVALARLGARDAVPALEQCLRTREFHALPEAFRALIALGDREAVPLAIARIEPAIRERNSGFVVNELRKVTGQSFGWEPEPWAAWWQRAGETWTIPDNFRKPWDLQPTLY